MAATRCSFCESKRGRTLVGLICSACIADYLECDERSEVSASGAPVCTSCQRTTPDVHRVHSGARASICNECLARCDEIVRNLGRAAEEVLSGAEVYTVEPGATWRTVFREEYAQWIAKTHGVLRAELSAVSSVVYEREAAGEVFGIEVTILEEEAEYLHVAIRVCGPTLWAGPRLSTSFIRYADGRLDA